MLAPEPHIHVPSETARDNANEMGGASKCAQNLKPAMLLTPFRGLVIGGSSTRKPS